MFPACYTGFADEAAPDLDVQIMPGFEAGNLHSIPDAAFEIVVARLAETGVRVNSLGSTLGNWAGDCPSPSTRISPPPAAPPGVCVASGRSSSA